MAPEDVCDGGADEVCLAGDGGLVPGAHLFPLIVAALLFVLLSRVAWQPLLRVWAVWCRDFCSVRDIHPGLKRPLTMYRSS